MKYRKYVILSTPLFIFAAGLQAQTAITAAGGNATGSGGTVSYTLGQPVYTTNTSTNGAVAQGVQQPFEISVVTAFAETKDIELNVSAYPNPTTTSLTLKIKAIAKLNTNSMRYQLYNIDGKLIEEKAIENAETIINFSNLAPSSYFLKVLETQVMSAHELKTFKIIKN